MSHKDHSFVAKLLLNGIVEDVIGHVSIQDTEWIVQDINVPVTVDRTGQADSMALPTTQIGTTLSNLMETEKSCITLSMH